MQKNITIKNIILHLLVFLFVFIPFLTFAQEDEYEVDPELQEWYDQYGEGGTESQKGLVPCVDDCNFSHVMELVNNIVYFVLFRLAVPIAAIMFAYAGFLLLFSGGEQAKRTKAKSIFINVGLGLAFALAAWLIVKTIFVVLGYTGASWIGF